MNIGRVLFFEQKSIGTGQCRKQIRALMGQEGGGGGWNGGELIQRKCGSKERKLMGYSFKPRWLFVIDCP